MKKAALLTFISLILSTLALPQENGQLLDSIVGYRFNSVFNTEQDSFAGYKHIYRYDGDNRQIFHSHSEYNSYRDTWTLYDYQIKKYDNAGRVIILEDYPTHKLTFPYPIGQYCKLEYEYNWDGNLLYEYQYGRWYDSDEWNLNWQTLFKINQKGLVEEKMIYRRDHETNNWNPQRYFHLFYNSQGFQVLENIEIWDSESSKWSLRQKNVVDYDYNGKKTFQAEYWWNKDSARWDIVRPSYWDYDSIGRLIEHKYSSWDHPIKYIDEYVYKDDNNYTVYHNNKIYYPEYRDWSLVGKTEYSFDEEGRRLLYAYFDWDSVQWVPIQRYEDKFNNEGKRIERITSHKDSETNAWKVFTWHQYEYNPHGNVGTIISIIDSTNTVYYKSYYYYHATSSGISETQINDISIFPNPTTGHINISGLTQPAEVKIFSMQGQELKLENQVLNGIDISDLPEGAYILSISVRGYPDLKKVIVKR